MSSVPARQDLAPIPRMLFMQARAAIVRNFRIPAFSLTSLALPIMFFAFFGLPNAQQTFPDGTSVGAYLLGSFGAYAVSSVMVFNFGIGVATMRSQKQDLLQRATPLPPAVASAANVLNALVFGFLSLVCLFLFAALVGGVRVGVEKWVQLIVLLLLGALPLIGLGMTIGYSFGANAAPAVTNLIYLPMSFASGLFIPLSSMPDFVQRIGHYLPTYHYGQLAWNTVGHGDESLGVALAWLAGWGVLLLGLALRAYRLDATRKFA